ncbi:phage tail protein [Acidiferrimicrobium sp. IK]|uniref:phage tail protein n=1 Tax=Acidiferrimicrobium sp. IK TaxID=2871700 RepID=UPI0021CB8F7C|nr:phage tail protein [Acidiferrimicrobium sp. IK]MCU4186042.1 phage tail protein [Acidiferrimicrobium sp. IK]
MPSTFLSSDPMIGTNFFLEIDGEVISNLMAVDGLSMEVEHTDFNERLTGGKLVQRVALSKPKMTGELTVKRLAPLDATSDNVWKWFDSVRKGDMANARKGGSIVIYGSNFTEISRWNFTDAFVTKIASDGVDVTKNDPITETITISYSGLERKK